MYHCFQSKLHSTNEIHKNYYSSPSTCSTTVIDNIPLPITRGDNTIAAQQAEHDDDIIGEEIRPVPVTTHDSRLQALHAFLQDHTYVAPMPARLPKEMTGVPASETVTTTPVQLISTLMSSPNRSSSQLQKPSIISPTPIPACLTTTVDNNRSNNNQLNKNTTLLQQPPVAVVSPATINNKTNNLHHQMNSSGGASGIFVSNNIIGQKIIDTTANVDAFAGKSTNKLAGTNASINNANGTIGLGTTPRKSRISETGDYPYGGNGKLKKLIECAFFFEIL